MKTQSVVLGAVVVTMVAAVGCSGKSGADAGPDSGIDAGAPTPLGQYCSDLANVYCPSGYSCLRGAGTGGQCSSSCTTGACETGADCVNVGTTTTPRNYCFVPCSATSPCPTGETCAAFSATSSYCIVDCTSHSDECGPRTACDPQARYCVGVGPSQFGDECGLGGAACSLGLSCLQAPGSTYAFCSQPCNTANPCPDFPAGAQCVLTVGTQRFCGFPCIPDDAGIPDGGPPDGGPADAGAPDSGPLDASTVDSGPDDAGTFDAGLLDAGAVDAGPPDAGPADAGAPDAAGLDAGIGDSGILSGSQCPASLTCVQLPGSPAFLCQ